MNPLRVAACLLPVCLVVSAVAAEVTLTLHPDRVLNDIDEKVYGHFLEHIYHSCDGGLWGELVWNRSFEENELGQWRVADGEVVQEAMGTDLRQVFGDADWGDYEYTLEAAKTGGNEGFLILFRVRDADNYYWCNLGGWGNRRHAIERGLSGEGRREVSPSVTGAIADGRWYRIRVRCEGPRFWVWVDDEPILDFTDGEGAHLAGAVGIGTWSTTARFRNLKVAALDGTVLHEGITFAADASSVARHWEAYGPGRVEVDDGDALNTRYCQQIAADGGETGVQQTPFCVRRGESYQGSVWARGTGRLVVRLLDGDTELARGRPGRARGEWREYPFRLRVRQDAGNATLRVGVEEGGEVRLDQVSLMPESWRRAGGFRPDLVQAIADLQPPIIRWPGGCFASAYRWKQGIGPQHQRVIHPGAIWDQQDVYSFGTDEFIALCRRVGAEPLIVVNIGTPEWVGPGREQEFEQELLDWIEYCNGSADSTWGKVRAANGHPEPYGVKYWEIDNETWHLRAEDYAAWVNRLAPRMRRADPSIRLAACGSGGLDDGGNGLAWNRVLIEQCADQIDYLSIHHYHDPNDFAAGPGRYEAFFRKTAELVRASRNPALKLYCSEWNAQSTDWRTGLYCGGLLNAFERCGAFFEIGGPALFLRHVSATGWDNAFINFDQCTWFPAPNYVVMRLWREHYAPRRVAVEGDAGPLNLVATRSEDGTRLYLKAVNPSAEPVSVSLAVPGLAGAAMRMVAPGVLEARNTLAEPDRVRPQTAPVQTGDQGVHFEFPALSCGVVEMWRDPGTGSPAAIPAGDSATPMFTNTERRAR